MAQFAGGDGSSSNPYQVATPAHLNEVRNYLSSYFIQTADIDMATACSLGGDYYNAGAGWDPIGTSIFYFKGSYNGQNYSISNLIINRPTEDAGLFEHISGGNAVVKLLKLTDCNIVGQWNAGAIASTIHSCLFRRYPATYSDDTLPVNFRFQLQIYSFF